MGKSIGFSTVNFAVRSLTSAVCNIAKAAHSDHSRENIPDVDATAAGVAFICPNRGMLSSETWNLVVEHDEQILVTEQQKTRFSMVTSSSCYPMIKIGFLKSKLKPQPR